MLAAVYRRKGPAREVLQIEELPTPEPGPGEVRVRVAFSGVNPSDVKSRAGSSNPSMDFPAVVPHSDGSGVVDAVGPGCTLGLRVGQRVWVYNAQWGRAWGTAAQHIVLPERLVQPLPDATTLEQGAGVAIPLITAFHAVACCGSLLGKTLLVPGAAGAVGQYVTQLARRGGARVIASVSSPAKADIARRLGAHEVVDYKRDDVAGRLRALTGGRGVDALIEVDAAANAAHYGDWLAFAAQVVVYGSGQAQVALPFRPLIMNFVNLQFFIMYRLPDDVMQRTLRGIGALLAGGDLSHPASQIVALDQVALAHETVEQGAEGKVLLRL